MSNYYINPDVPSYIKEQYNGGLLSEKEFERKAEEALNGLKELRDRQDEKEDGMIAEQTERSDSDYFESTRGVETI